MEYNESKEAEGNSTKKYFWSPSISWKICGGKLKIAGQVYPDVYIGIFPEFYYITQDGATIETILNTFGLVDNLKLCAFLKHLISKKILTDSPLSPHELFYSQKKLYESEYPNDLMFNPEESEKFKEKQQNRFYDKYDTQKLLKLDDSCKLPEIIANRRTYRKFDEKKIISYEDFSTVMTAFKQNKTEDGNLHYYYASAGGLYPIDVYVYVKKDRIENLEKGLYYYSPMKNTMYLIDSLAQINALSQYFINKDTFNSAAFTVYFVYNTDCNMPKYHEMGYFYACLDTGIMVATFTNVCESLNMAVCSIGDMQFNKIKKYFKLSGSQIYLHEMEV